MSDEKKPVQGKTEENLSYNLRVSAWQRKMKKRAKEMAKPKPENEDPSESVDTAVRDAWTRSERELEKMGE